MSGSTSRCKPPRGLDREIFDEYLAGILQHMPLVSELDQLAQNGLSDNKAYELLTDRLPSDQHKSVQQVWAVLKAWLTHFFPRVYRIETAQETLVRGRRLNGSR